MDRISVLVGGVEAICGEQGSGPPLLLVHGWGASHRIWRSYVPEAIPRYRVIAPDLPGWGDSEKPKAAYDHAWYADWLAALLEARRAPAAMVAGHSFGAAVAVELALRHPGRVTRLALLSPILKGSGSLRKESRLLSKPGLRTLLYPLSKTRPVLRFIARHFRHVGPMEEEDLLAIRRGTYASTLRSLKALRETDLTPRLKELTVPVLVLTGERDEVVRPEEAREAASAIPGATVEMVDDAGHLLPLEQPQETARRLTAFFGPGVRRARPRQW